MKANLNLKRNLLAGIIGMSMLMTSCVIVDNTPGPPGYDGEAYFGIDYDVAPPYSYWDNNPAVPNTVMLGQYYHTRPGVYDFEYFINRQEFWYGTYEIWVNPGGPGGSYGEPGFDGLDNFLMLICDPDGYYEYRSSYKQGGSEYEPLVIEGQQGQNRYKITIQKGKPGERKPDRIPKFRSSEGA
ncbi:MAG: hypothetical protein AAGB22_07855 [Bacteroidota bacterium]